MVPESLRLMLFGVNHRTAPVELREALAFDAERAAAAMGRLRERFGGTGEAGMQAVILSTCNRVEIYLAATKQVSRGEMAQFLAECHGIGSEAIGPHLYELEEEGVARHLFAVASSLDSMVVGETQILGQVKEAYQQACTCGGVGKLLHALFQRALAAAKDVHENTNLSAGRLSVASVAVDLARSVFDRFDDKTVVCLGAGKMAGLMMRHLRGLGPRRVVIANRSLERAQAAAAEFGGEAKGIEALEELLVEADILLASTGAPHALVTEAGFRGLLKARKYRPIVMVDIAVPRDVEAAVGKLANVYLYNVDDLQEAAAGNRGKREQEVAAAQGVVERHVRDFLKWSAARDVGPLVKALYERCRAMARAELEEAISRRPEMSAAERAELERLTHRLIGKMLHEPVTKLTADNADPLAAAGLSAALKELFNLKPPSGE